MHAFDGEKDGLTDREKGNKTMRCIRSRTVKRINVIQNCSNSSWSQLQTEKYHTKVDYDHYQLQLDQHNIKIKNTQSLTVTVLLL